MKKTILHFFLLFSAISISAQSNFFNKKIKQSENFYIDFIKNINDNDFFIKGSYASGSKNFLTHLDANANVLWAKKTVATGFDAFLNDGIVLKDGNILVAYSEVNNSFSTPSRRYIVKMDSTMSNVIWAMENSVNNVQITSVKELENGNIVFVSIYQVNLQDYYTVVFTLDGTGKLVWQKSFKHGTNSGNSSEFGNIEELNDGQLLLSGYLISGTSNEKLNAKLLKLNVNDGTIIWQNDYKTTNNNNLADYNVLSCCLNLAFKVRFKSQFWCSTYPFSLAAGE